MARCSLGDLVGGGVRIVTFLASSKFLLSLLIETVIEDFRKLDIPVFINVKLFVFYSAELFPGRCTTIY